LTQTFTDTELTVNHKTSLPENAEPTADLQQIIDTWEHLPEHSKQTILDIIESTKLKDETDV
jgi:hypothetical protein